MRTIKPQNVTTFALTDWDPDGETWVAVKEHRAADTLRRNRLWDQEMVIESGPLGELKRLKDNNLTLLPAIECYLSFGGSNIATEDEDGRIQQLFRPDMGEDEFLAMYNLLPDELAHEWHSLVIQVNPAWN